MDTPFQREIPDLSAFGRLDSLFGGKTTPRETLQMSADKRRYGMIEVRRINAETYWLEINGQMWSEVEWSPSRRAWCVQNAAGQCLTHVEHIVGQDRDPQAALRLARRMILDGW